MSVSAAAESPGDSVLEDTPPVECAQTILSAPSPPGGWPSDANGVEKIGEVVVRVNGFKKVCWHCKKGWFKRLRNSLLQCRGAHDEGFRV